MSKSKIAILAGNPRVGIAKNGELLMDPQMEAFEEAMKIVSECREQVAKIVVLFDHRRIFKKRFVDRTLGFGSNKKKKKEFDHLRMSHLLPQIRQVYEETAQRYGVNLEQIKVLSEDLCRLEIFKRAESNRELKALAINHCVANCDADDDMDDIWEEDIDGENAPALRSERVNCPGITAAAIAYLAKGLESGNSLTTCWQFNLRRVNNRNVAVGTQIAQELLGVKNPIEVRYVCWPMPDGTIAKTTIVQSH